MSFPVMFKNISKVYADRKILNEVNIDFPENKITAIIGKSGSGKSTLLKIINGLVAPTSGEVIVFEKVIDYKKLNELRLRIGYSVQGTTLFPHLNVYDNITLLACLNKWDGKRIEDRISSLMKLVNLPHSFRKKFPFQLSGGEQQRVGICRAMMLNPPVFLLDEAFGALDPATKSEIHFEFLKIQTMEPRTVIMVTHDLQEAFRLADRIVIIDGGVIQQTGSKDEIMSKPANDFVKKFVSSQLEA